MTLHVRVPGPHIHTSATRSRPAPRQASTLDGSSGSLVSIACMLTPAPAACASISNAIVHGDGRGGRRRPRRHRPHAAQRARRAATQRVLPAPGGWASSPPRGSPTRSPPMRTTPTENQLAGRPALHCVHPWYCACLVGEERGRRGCCGRRSGQWPRRRPCRRPRRRPRRRTLREAPKATRPAHARARMRTTTTYE